MKVLLVLFCFLPMALSAEVMKFYAENIPPYHYIDEQGKPAGALVEIIVAAASRADIEADVRLLPFARGYQTMLSNPNTFMFSLIRTPEREKKMQWVGKVYKNDAFLVGLKGKPDLRIKQFDDAKNFVVGTIRGYSSERFLKSAGFLENRNLFLSINYKLMWQMLFRGRVDYVLANTMSLETELASLGLDTKGVERYLEITDFPSELFIVTHLKTPQSVVKRLSDGLALVKTSGQYQKIIDKWGL